MKKKKRLVKSAEFSFGKGKSLVVYLSSNIGLDRIIVENKNGVVCVRAEGHSRFEFDDKKREPNTCEFWLGNPPITVALKDYLYERFWGQLNWGELFRYQDDTKLKRALKAKIQKLVNEFESKAAQQLKDILKKQKRERK